MVASPTHFYAYTPSEIIIFNFQGIYIKKFPIPVYDESISKLILDEDDLTIIYKNDDDNNPQMLIEIYSISNEISLYSFFVPCQDPLVSTKKKLIIFKR